MKKLALAITTVLILTGSAFAQVYPAQELRFTWEFEPALETEITGFRIELYSQTSKTVPAIYYVVGTAVPSDREFTMPFITFSRTEIYKYYIGAVYKDGFIARFGPAVYLRHPVPTGLTVEGQ